MSKQRYTPEFKDEAARQIVARGYSVVDALLMAVWQRKPADTVIVHSDQGSQYGSDD